MRLRLADREVDLATGAVTSGAEALQRLSGRELAVLRYLARHPRRLVGRDELYRAVWGADGAASRATDHAVSRLRARVEADPVAPRHVVTVFGEGYRFEPLTGSEEVGVAAATAPPPEPPLALGDRRLDLARHRVTGPDGVAPLSGNEVALLRCLVQARGAVVERSTLRRALRITDRALDNAVSRLRGKLEAEPARPRHLRTAKAGGYQLELGEGADLPDLLGRDDLLAEARVALSASPWVVLVGPGGAGKTTLARRLAAERGAPWVDLASARTGDEAAASVAAALGLAEGSADAVAACARRGLVVLDNLEPLGDALLPLLRAWVRPGSGLRWLGTTRVRPGHDGEVAIEVGPLSEAAAIELFATRARAAASRFEPEASLPAIAALVSRLDGLPLAIELAAARVGVLTPAEQLERLDRRLQWLQRPGAAVERHRSLRAVLDGSWELLAAQDARLLEALACFTGSFDLADAEGAGGPEALDGLQRLRDHSLVHARPAGGLAIYESIREYVAERRRAAADEGRGAEQAFVGWMARWGAPEHLDRLWHRGHEGPTAAHERSADDLLAAVDLALRWGALGDAVRCAVAAAHVRRRTGPYAPSIARLQAVLAAGAEAPEARWLLAELLVEADRPQEALARLGEPPARGELRGRWFGVRARARLDQGEMEGGIADLGVAVEALAAVRPDLAAWHRARRIVLSHAVGAAVGTGDEALASYQRAEALAHERGDELLSALALHQLARFDLANGRPTLAADRFRETRRRFLEARSRARALGASTDLLHLLSLSGDAEAHEAVGAEAIEEARELGLRVDEATAWVYLAAGRHVRGEDGPAREASAEARAVMARTRPLPRGLGYLEVREAERAARRGDGGSALALAAAARARFESLRDVANQARADVAAALGLTAAGRPAEARRQAEDALRQLTTYDRPPALVARGLAKRALGDRAGAEADLAEAEAEARSSGFTDPRSECGRALEWLRDALNQV